MIGYEYDLSPHSKIIFNEKFCEIESNGNKITLSTQELDRLEKILKWR